MNAIVWCCGAEWGSYQNSFKNCIGDCILKRGTLEELMVTHGYYYKILIVPVTGRKGQKKGNCLFTGKNGCAKIIVGGGFFECSRTQGGNPKWNACAKFRTIYIG